MSCETDNTDCTCPDCQFCKTFAGQLFSFDEDNPDDFTIAMLSDATRVMQAEHVRPVMVTGLCADGVTMAFFPIPAWSARCLTVSLIAARRSLRRAPVAPPLAALITGNHVRQLLGDLAVLVESTLHSPATAEAVARVRVMRDSLAPLMDALLLNAQAAGVATDREICL